MPRTSAHGLATYLHDDTNQLTDADYDGQWQDDEDYDYDDNGNRTNGGYTTGLNNRMTSDGTYTYEYDAEGNRTKRYIAGTPDTDVTEYEWDHRNRLVKITERATAGGAATKIIEYYYDHENRWVRKVLDSDGDTDTDASTIFVYDGKQMVLQFDDDDDQDLAAGDLSHRYLWGPAVDQVLVDEQVSSLSTPGARYWALSDHLGSVRDVIDDSATLQLHRIYDAFGNIIGNPDPANVTHLFAFTARPLDEDSGLQNNLNRWYDLSTGRWMSEDPIGFEARDANLYRYVRNASLGSRDPWGLWTKVSRTVYEADHSADHLSNLARLITGDASDWPCIKILECRARPNYVDWEGYPYPDTGALADVSNLMARDKRYVLGEGETRHDILRTGVHLTMMSPMIPVDDGYMKALKDVIPGERHWENTADAVKMLGDSAGYGNSPISRLIIGGHHYQGDGVIVTLGGGNRAQGLSAGDVMRLAPEGLRNNQSNSPEHAKKGHGPPKCWFTKDAQIWGASCSTQDGWDDQWALTVARRGATVHGTPTGLENRTVTIGDGFGRHDEYYFIWFDGAAADRVRTLQGLLGLAGWSSLPGSQ